MSPNGRSGNKYIGVNVGGKEYCCGNEPSDFAVAEVMTWKVSLSATQMKSALTHLKSVVLGNTCPA